MTPTLLIYVLIGGGLGALLGYFGQCSSGACPLTANWRRGAIYGMVLATVFCFASGQAGNAPEMNRSTAHVKHITAAEFDAEVTHAARPVVADFYATWCGPCRELAPVVDKLADQYAGKIKFVKVNVDESPKLAAQFQVEGIPALLFFKDGKLAGASVGLVGREDLIAKLDSLIQTNTPPGAAVVR